MLLQVSGGAEAPQIEQRAGTREARACTYTQQLQQRPQHQQRQQQRQQQW